MSLTAPSPLSRVAPILTGDVFEWTPFGDSPSGRCISCSSESVISKNFTEFVWEVD